MPDPIPAPQPPVAPAPTQNQPPAPPANEPAKPLTIDQLKEVLAPFEQRLNGLSGIVSGLQRGKPKDEPGTPKEPTLADQANELSNLRKQIDTERVENAITAAAAKQVGERSEQFTRYITAVYGSQLVVEGRQVMHTGSDGQKTPISEWVNAFLQTRDGEVFLPPKAGATGDGLRGTGGTGGAKADHPFKALAFDKIMDAQKKTPGAFGEYRQQHPEDFEKKRAAFYGS